MKEKRNTSHTIGQRKVNWIGHILLRNCLLKHVIEGKGREDEEVDVSSYSMIFKESKRYRKLKDEALYSSLWRTYFGRCYGPVVRQTR